MTSTLSKPLGTRESIGPYRIVKPLDEERGIYLAEEPIGRRQVVVHAVTVGTSCQETFFREMRRLGRLQHEHIVPLIDSGESNGMCFLVSEALKGDALQARLKREHRLPLKEAIRIAREVASALTATHALGVIHRDLCPANVWLEPSGQARLTGFGTGPGEEDSLLSRLNGPGTPGYLSPEQAAGETTTFATDLFSLGCVLYQMATGEPPFRGDNSAALFRAVIFDHPKAARQINPEISEELEDLLMRLLAKMPADRPASVAEVEQRLAAMLDPTAPKSPKMPAPVIFPASKRILDTLAETRTFEPVPSPPALSRVEIRVASPTPPAKRTWLPDLIAGLLLVVAASGLYLWWKASNEPPPQPPIVKPESVKR